MNEEIIFKSLVSTLQQKGKQDLSRILQYPPFKRICLYTIIHARMTLSFTLTYEFHQRF